MNARTLAELALKIWAVFQLISAAAALPSVILFGVAEWNAEGEQALILRLTQHTQVILLVTNAIVGFAVLLWADNIVALFEDDTTPLQIDADRSELQSLGFGVVGILFLIPGLEDVVASAYVLWRVPSSWSQADTMSMLWQQRGEMILRGVVEIVAGVILVFGRSRIVRAWSRMRGQPLDEEAADDEVGDLEAAEDEQDDDRR